MSLFGTDGIRGRVGQGPIDPSFFLHLGWAAGCFAQGKRVILAKDPRLSGYMLESALVAGLTSAGCDVLLTGPLPTPALAYLTQSLCAELGLMISASHNPYHDNGVKFFYQGACKLTDRQQETIEQLLKLPMSLAKNSGKAYRLHDAQSRYVKFLKKQIQPDILKNKMIAIDCANGAAYKVGPQIFEECQAIVRPLNIAPDGFNINDRCGVMDLSEIQRFLETHACDYGIALDGDADRLSLFVNHEQCDPHYILLMLYELYEKKYDYQGGIVGTALHNQGLLAYCASHNIPWVQADVGDRNLIHAALKNKFQIAGEPSGHYILMDRLSTADALLVALLLIEHIESGQGKSLQWYKDNVPLCPSYDFTIDAPHPKMIVQKDRVQSVFQKISKEFPEAKILLRGSGTESLIRLHLESHLGQKWAEYCYIQLKEVIEKELVADELANEVYLGKNIDSQLEASLG